MNFQTNLFKSSVRCISFDMFIYFLFGCVFLIPERKAFPNFDLYIRDYIFWLVIYLFFTLTIYVAEIYISALMCTTIKKRVALYLCVFPLLDLLFIYDFWYDGWLHWWNYIFLILYKIGSSIYKHRKYKTILN